MSEKGKKYRAALNKVDRNQRYLLEDSLRLAKETACAKFDETVEMAIRLGVDPRQADQNIRGTVTLPHGMGKSVRVLAFAKGDKEKEAQEAGADFVGSDELIKKISEGWLDFDKAVATPDMMGAVGRIGKILGPRGLMPNPKTGTVAMDIGKAVKEIKAGKLEFRVDKAGIVHVPAPYCYRCPLGLTYPTCKVKCADVVEDAVKTRVPGTAAAMIAEPVICVGGVLTPPPEYWPKVEAICRRNNITLIHDEVFSGWGRTGRMFAHEHWNSKPDVVTFAKAIGGGLPLGGFIATEEVGMAFEEGDHFATFGANNQVGIAAGHAVLDVLEREQLPARSAEMGGIFLEGLRRLAAKRPNIGDVRGLGLMIGVEIVKDRGNREPAPQLTKQLQQAMRERGVLVSITGVHGCVLRITPPLVITAAQVDFALKTLDAAFAACAGA